MRSAVNVYASVNAYEFLASVVIFDGTAMPRRRYLWHVPFLLSELQMPRIKAFLSDGVPRADDHQTMSSISYAIKHGPL